MANHALVKRLSYRQLREAIALDLASRSDSASRRPAILKLLNSSRKLFGLENGRQFFLRAQLDDLTDQQRKDAIKSAGELLEALKNLVLHLRRT